MIMFARIMVGIGLAIFMIIAIVVISILGGDVKDENVGTLHKASFQQWEKATYQNKYATSLSVIMLFAKTKVFVAQDINNIDKLKPLITQIIDCIDEINQEYKKQNYTSSGAEATVTDAIYICQSNNSWLEHLENY